MSYFDYQSVVRMNSALCPGVSYLIEKMSFGRRVALMKVIRETTIKSEFLEAEGSGATMTSAITAAEVSRLYIQWGLKEVSGLLIDGSPSTPESFVASGPEELFHEAFAFVLRECHLNEEEKKT